MHASPRGRASVSYALNKKYSIFDASVCLNDSSPRSSTPLTFSVYGDERLLWQSEAVLEQSDLQPCRVSIKDVATLKLTVTSAGDVHGAHGVWLEPYVSREEQ
jgi:hypothetical protein